MFVFCDWPHMFFAKNLASIIFSFSSWLSFQRLSRFLCGYHFHFVDSNRGSNNLRFLSLPDMSGYSSLPRCWQPPCLSLLNDGLFQFSTFGSVGNVCSNLQATVFLFQLASHWNSSISITTKTANKQVTMKVVARGHIAAAALWIRLIISTTGKSKFAQVLTFP